jgi:hypothetical protein
MRGFGVDSEEVLHGKRKLTAAIDSIMYNNKIDQIYVLQFRNELKY